MDRGGGGEGEWGGGAGEFPPKKSSTTKSVPNKLGEERHREKIKQLLSQLNIN